MISATTVVSLLLPLSFFGGDAFVTKSPHPSLLSLCHRQQPNCERTKATALPAMEDEDNVAADMAILDDMVQLYGKAVQNTVDEADDEISSYRQQEVTALIEDTVLSLYSRREESLTLPQSLDSSTLSEETKKMELSPKEQQPLRDSLVTVSQALDRTILDRYDPNLSMEEMEQWVQQIASLNVALETQIQRSLLPGAAVNDDANEQQVVDVVAVPDDETVSIVRKPVVTMDELQARLENLRTLIDPTGAYPQRIPPIVVGSQKATASKAAAAEFLNEPAVLATNDNMPKGGVFDPSTAFFASVEESSSSTSVDVNVAMALATAAASVDQNATATVGNNDDNNYDYDEAVDVLSAVLGVAALSAAAVTKMPFIAAGVALGPAIRTSIAYAKGRMAASNITATMTVNADNDDPKLEEDVTAQGKYSMISKRQEGFKKEGDHGKTGDRKRVLLEPDILA